MRSRLADDSPDGKSKMRLAWLLCLAACLLMPPAQAAEPDPWAPWRFLIGTWTAEGAGQPGQGTGSFSFEFGLEEKFLVQKSRLDFSATKDRPAFHHNDLMVIFPIPGTTRLRAVYTDNEGHVIHYSANFSEDSQSLVFLSDPERASPRYRLSYTKAKDGALEMKFEIAPPDKPNAFSTYLEGVARPKATP